MLIRDDLFDVLGGDYHTLARIDAPGHATQFAFTPETRETRVRLDAGPAGGRGWASFLLGLLLRGGGWFSLAKIITAFTLAHSVTLALAVLDVVVLPDRLVEAVIALSIAFVAAENLFLSPVVSRRSRRPSASSACPPTASCSRSSGSTPGSRSGRPSSWPWPCRS